MPLSPEALAKIAEALPDTYETNPEQFATDYAALKAAQQQAEQLQQLDTWYQNDYQPWFQAYGGDFAEFQRWKQSGGKPPAAAEPEPPATTTRSGSPDALDYDSPDALKSVVSHFASELDQMRHGFEDRFKLTDATIQQRTDEMQRLLALQEEAYGLLNEATWDKVEPGWRPPVDISKLVSYAQQQNIPSLRRAYQSYSQSDREKEIERRAYERGKEEATRAAASQQVTTEMSSGTPWRHALPAERKRGNAGTEEILNILAQRRAAQR
jgi:hypothetical protein